MQLFYDPQIQPGPHRLRPEEASHAARVLRKKVGDRLDLVDGKGGWYQARITEITKRECLVDGARVQWEESRAAHELRLLLAPTKSIDRLEWALEKATEIGVDHIHLILTEHSERKRVRPDRLERILESAMKQSLKAWLPTLHDLRPFPEVMEELAAADAQKLLAYLGADETPALHHTYTPGGDVYLAVGPEGGFSPAEAELAARSGFHNVSLGPHRLRTETAAICAVHTIEQLNW